MKGRTDTPQDRFCLVGIFFFILGLGTLLPWNFFMTASLYFQSRLNNTELTNGTAVTKEYHFNNWMTFLSQLPLLVFTLLNSFMYQRISEAIRIAGSLVFILLLFILTAVLVKVDMHQDLFFSVTMAIIWFINSFGAVLQGSLFGLVGLLPQNYSAVFMSGQGLAGTFAAIAMLLTTANGALAKIQTGRLDQLHHIIQSLRPTAANPDRSFTPLQPIVVQRHLQKSKLPCGLPARQLCFDPPPPHLHLHHEGRPPGSLVLSLSKLRSTTSFVPGGKTIPSSPSRPPAHGDPRLTVFCWNRAPKRLYH